MKKNVLRLAALSGAVLLATGAYAATATYTGTGTPVAIPDAGAAVTSTATAPGPAATTNITDVNASVAITHTWNGDIDVTMAATNPTVAATALFADCGGSGNNITVTIDDQAAAAMPCATGTITGTFRSPVGATVMSAFNGSATAAPNTWTLSVVDDSAFSTGTLTSFSVTVTSAIGLPVELSNFSID